MITNFVVLKFEIKGRIRLLRELGRHWSILTGEECFKVFDDNLIALAQEIDQVPINEKETTRSIKRQLKNCFIIYNFLDFANLICSNDELFNELVDQLRLDIQEGTKMVDIQYLIPLLFRIDSSLQDEIKRILDKRFIYI